MAAGMLGTAALIAAGAFALLPAELEWEFTRVDANGDGRIAWHEAWANPTVERRFMLGERDQNGTLDRAEFQDLITTSASRSRT